MTHYGDPTIPLGYSDFTKKRVNAIISVHSLKLIGNLVVQYERIKRTLQLQEPLQLFNVWSGVTEWRSGVVVFGGNLGCHTHASWQAHARAPEAHDGDVFLILLPPSISVHRACIEPPLSADVTRGHVAREQRIDVRDMLHKRPIQAGREGRVKPVGDEARNLICLLGGYSGVGSRAKATGK